ISHYVHRLFFWRTDDVELDVHSDHLPITFNVKTTWSSPRIERQKIETWNLRNNKWEQFRLILKRNIENWMKSIDSIVSRDQDSLDKAAESWPNMLLKLVKQQLVSGRYGKATSHGGVIVYIDYEREFKNQRTDFVNKKQRGI
ncbi:hypothetical protein RFI_35143, partial [Reticulomyxa filosa]